MLTDRAFVMALAGEALRLRESNAALQPPTDCQSLLEAQQSLLEAQGTEVINVDSVLLSANGASSRAVVVGLHARGPTTKWHGV